MILAVVVLVPLAVTLWLLVLASDDLRVATNERRVANERGILVTQVGLRVVDIETALRGYALTGNPDFLTPRDQAVVAIPKLERQIRVLDGVDPATAKLLRAFASTVDAYVRDYADPLLKDLRNHVRTAHSGERTMEGKTRVDSVRAQYAELVRRAQATADVGTARANASADRTSTIGTIGLISLPLLVILAALIASRELRLAGRKLSHATAETSDVAETNRALLDASNDGYVALDEDGVVIAYTAQAARIYGYPQEEVIGHVLADIVFPPEGRADHHARRHALLASGRRSAPYRVWIRQPSGRAVLIEVTAAPVTTSQRRMGAYFVRDVTDQTLREQERQAEEAVNRVLVQADAADDLILPIVAAIGTSLRCLHGTYWEFDETEQAIRCVETWRADSFVLPELTRRLKAERYVPGAPTDATHPVALAWATRTEQWSLLADTAIGGSLSAEDRDGVSGIIVVPATVDGEARGVFAFATTDRDQPDDLRWAALRAIADLTGQVIGRLRAEREADRLTNEFFALISHELRTPLTSVMGYLDMVRDEEVGALNDQQQRYLTVVDRSARRLMRLVGDLLFVAQIEAGRMTLDLAPTDLRAVVHDAVEAATPRAEQGQVTLSDETAELELPSGDADRLGQLVDNLISNAIKFTPHGGSIAVRLWHDGQDAVIEVQDTGPGISAEDEDHLFDRFFRAEHAHRDAVAGLGLGLSICSAIVNAHGGRLSVATALGGGTLALVRLPLSAG